MASTSSILLVLVALAILAVDFAALDDITTGNEPHLYWEWLFLVLSVPLLAVLSRFISRNWRRQPS